MVSTPEDLIQKDIGKGWWSVLLSIKEGYKVRNSIARKVHVSNNTVDRRLRELMDEGYIERCEDYRYEFTEQGEGLMETISDAFHD